jgi:hypothetical protein
MWNDEKMWSDGKTQNDEEKGTPLARKGVGGGYRFFRTQHVHRHSLRGHAYVFHFASLKVQNSSCRRTLSIFILAIFPSNFSLFPSERR